MTAYPLAEIYPALTLSCDAGVMGDNDHRRVICVIELLLLPSS